MNILCVIDSLGSGGAQRQLVNLGKGFKEYGHEVSFLVYHHETFFEPELEELNISIKYIIEPNYLKRIYKIRRYIRNGSYDAVLSFLEAANFMCEIAGLPIRKWRLVVGERDANPNIYRSFKLKFYRWFHVFSDYVVSNSNENIKIVKKINPLISSRKCKVIYNMVDYNMWRPSSSANFSSGKYFVLTVAASHQYKKNAAGLISAVNLIKKDIVDKLIINWYGDESNDKSFQEAKKLIKIYSLSNTIKFMKATDNIKEIIQKSDAIGLFSYYEGFPNIICEAMACEKLIISSNVSDIPFILKNQSEFLVNPNDPIEIANTIEKAISLPVKTINQIGKNNRSYSLKIFNKNSILQSYLNLLQ